MRIEEGARAREGKVIPRLESEDEGTQGGNVLPRSIRQQQLRSW